MQIWPKKALSPTNEKILVENLKKICCLFLPKNAKKVKSRDFLTRRHAAPRGAALDRAAPRWIAQRRVGSREIFHAIQRGAARRTIARPLRINCDDLAFLKWSYLHRASDLRSEISAGDYISKRGFQPFLATNLK